MEVLATILHISDLHIGLIDPAGASSMDAEVREWWRHMNLFDGYLGHSTQALKQLAQTFYDLSETETNVHLVVTGDVTSCGHSQEFVNAEAYLAGTLKEPLKRSQVGLGVDWKDVVAISGNHDNWSGKLIYRATDKPMLEGPTQTLRMYFGTFPRELRKIPLKGHGHLLICGIDSDSDVPASDTRRRILARGSFVSQCTKLTKQLPPKPDDEIRVLLIHHSYAWGDHRWKQLCISRRSRRALEQLIKNRSFSLMLTGHVHEPCVERTPPVEVRCGTSTQRDFYPATWPPNARKVAPPNNTALIHRVIEDNGSLYWKTEFLIRSRTAGHTQPFEPDTRFQMPELICQLP